MSDSERKNRQADSPETAKSDTYGWWYDPATGVLGWGPTFGEKSFNGRRIGAIYGWDNVNSYLRGEWNGLGMELQQR